MPADRPDLVVEVLRRAIDDYGTELRFFSPAPYRVTADRVEVWDPPREHPAALLVDEARIRLTDTEYAEQERQFPGYPLARYWAMNAPSGGWWSWAFWGPDGATLVPEVNRLIVDAGGGMTVEVPFGVALELAGDELAADPDWYPARWLAAAPPSAALLDQLVARGTVRRPSQ